jgi:hypothetical protein
MAATIAQRHDAEETNEDADHRTRTPAPAGVGALDAGTTDGAFKSTDGASSWEAASPNNIQANGLV